jgi:hypothetical protein
MPLGKSDHAITSQWRTIPSILCVRCFFVAKRVDPVPKKKLA